MNKTMRNTMGAVLLSAGMLAGVAAAVVTPSNVTATLMPQRTITIDGVNKTFFNVEGEELHPLAYNNTTYLPLRSIGEIMGKNVNWDGTTNTATVSGNRTTGVTVGAEDLTAVEKSVTARLCPDYTIIIDSTARTFYNEQGNIVYPLNYDGSIYLPIRSIGEIMGKTVGWDGTTNTVTISGQVSGNVTDADSFNPSTGNTSTTTGLIGEAAAKQKALSHAGLKDSQVTFVRAYLDWDDGRQIYDVEFYTADYKEYDYEIDAKTGEILSYDQDADYYQRPSTGTTTDIGMEKAKEIALKKASGTVVKTQRDYDDGRYVYEIEIISGTTKHEFEIDGATGTIISHDRDSIYD